MSTPARVFVTAAVGYVIAPRDGDTDDELLRRVDLAVEKAKEAGDPVCSSLSIR